jgi:hypothetical protein
MSGLGPTYYLPWGASASWSIAFTQADGTPLDLTAASAITFGLSLSPTLPVADNELTLSLGAGLTVTSAAAGLVSVSLTAAQSLALRCYGPFFYTTRATLASGAIVLPATLRGEFYNDLDLADLKARYPDTTFTSLDNTGGTTVVVAVSPAVLNRFDLTGLLGNTATTLDGLSTAALALLPNGTMVRLFFSGSIVADFRLRANAGAETESAPWRVLCDNTSLRLWELVSVSKQGVPCVWVASLSKFKQILENSGSIALADDADAFVLP